MTLIFILFGTLFVVFICIRGTVRLVQEWKDYDTPSKIINIALNILCYIYIGYLLYDSKQVQELIRYFVN